MRFPVLAIYLDRKQLVSFAVLAFVIGGLLGGLMWNYGGVYVPRIRFPDLSDGYTLTRFNTDEELMTFLNERGAGVSLTPDGAIDGAIVLYIWGRGFTEFSIDWAAEFDVSSSHTPFLEDQVGEAISAAQAAEAAASASEALSAEISELGYVVDEFSGTNIQVEGVDEADLVKTDGRYIYLADNSTVFIVRAYPPEEARVESRIEFESGVKYIYVNGDRLVTITSSGSHYYFWTTMNTTVSVYDISDRSSPILERAVDVDGGYINSRMIGDHVYMITGERPLLLNNGTEVDMPSTRSDGCVTELSATDIYYVNGTDSGYRFTYIYALNVMDPGEPVTQEAFLLDGSSCMYVSKGSIYITAPKYIHDTEGGWEGTIIYRFSVDGGDVEFMADGFVPGYVLNQFSMDEHEGYFRMATSDSESWGRTNSSANSVYVLDGDLDVVGWLEGIAPGERIYSARFMGEKCYIVTFRETDPLFVIDLKHPENPRVLGKLKIPGFSLYLHPYDEDHLIGLGIETVEDESGGFAWELGVKVSLFDVSDISNPREVAKYVIGDRGTESPALYDHRAFLFSRGRNLLVIPILLADIPYRNTIGEIPLSMHGEHVYQGAYVFDISPENGITVKGRVTHMEGPEDVMKRSFSYRGDYEVYRSLYIHETLYTISRKMIKMNDLGDLSEVGTVELN